MDDSSTAPATSAPRLSDAQALDAVAHMLRDPEWNSGMLEDINELVCATGRDTAGDDETATWDRH